MLNIFYNILFFIISIIQALIQGFIILRLFNSRSNLKNMSVFAIIITLGGQLPPIFFSPEQLLLNSIIYIGVIFLSIKLIFKFNLPNAILGTISVFLLIAIVEYICMAIMKIGVGNSFNSIEWSKSIDKYLLMRSLGLFICTIIAALIHYFRINVSMEKGLNKKRILTVLIHALLVFILVIPNLIYFITSVSETPKMILIFNFVALVALLAFSIYSNYKIYEFDKKQRDMEIEQLYSSTLVNTIDSLRSFKHDFGNIVNTLQGFLLLEDFEGIKNFCKQIQGEVIYINNFSPVNTYLRNNPPIYGLLVSKISHARNIDVNFNINISTELTINSNKIRTLDLCKMLGVLIDNAIEAAEQSKKRYVELNIHNPRGHAIKIEIINSFVGDIDIEQIYKDGYSTKNAHSGFGLYQVKKLAHKYERFLSMGTEVFDSMFIQTLEIFNKEVYTNREVRAKHC